MALSNETWTNGVVVTCPGYFTYAYNTGWNEALSACGIGGGGIVYTGALRPMYDLDTGQTVLALNPYTAHTVGAK